MNIFIIPPSGMRLLRRLGGLTLGLLWLGWAGVAPAGIYYDPAGDAINVTCFPECAPCTPRHLYKLDRLFSWGKVTYDPATDIYVVNCHLQIGSHDGATTYFQLGSVGHPRETLVMGGNLSVRPSWIQGVSPETTWDPVKAGVNALVMGSSDDDAIKPVLMFKSGTTLSVGFPIQFDGKVQRGGELLIYNSKITAPDGEFWAPEKIIVYPNSSAIIENSELSRFKGYLYGVGGQFKTLKNTTFANGGAVIVGQYRGKDRIESCTFENMETAILDYGGLDATFVNCVFKNNDNNWILRFYYGITCIDCTCAPPKKGNGYSIQRDPKTGEIIRQKTGEIIRPAFTSKRHISVKVVNANGSPVTNAEVTVAAEQSDSGLGKPLVLRTDATGQTPGRGNENAILLTEVIEEASETINQPKVSRFTYTVRVRAKNMRDEVMQGVIPDKSWKILNVTLKDRGPTQL